MVKLDYGLLYNLAVHGLDILNVPQRQQDAFLY